MQFIRGCVGTKRRVKKDKKIVSSARGSVDLSDASSTDVSVRSKPAKKTTITTIKTQTTDVDNTTIVTTEITRNRYTWTKIPEDDDNKLVLTVAPKGDTKK